MIELVNPRVEIVDKNDQYGRFVIEPLEAGFGATLGNALRRVLLSSLEGAAVTSVKIEEVQHEFSTIPGVKEDTTEILLNIKGVRLRSFTDRTVKMRLEVSGEGEVTAGDIQAPADVEVVNPEQHIATLDSPDAHLTMEFTVERSKGYSPAGVREGLPIGVIPVDAIFTPIRKVNYVVEPTRVGAATSFDRLTIDVWTDGAIEPQEALSQASQILQRHLQLLGELGRAPARVGGLQVPASVIPQKIYDMPIEELDLSVRAYNCLKRSGITKVGQVLEMDEDDLLAVRNFGRKSLDELREKLSAKALIPTESPKSWMLGAEGDGSVGGEEGGEDLASDEVEAPVGEE